MAKFKRDDVKEIHVTLKNDKEFIFKEEGLKAFFRAIDETPSVPVTPKTSHIPYTSYNLDYGKSKSAEELRREAEGMVKFDYH